MTGVTKRLLDLALASSALVVLSPLLAALWLGVRLTSPGPAVFRQQRLGLAERPFTIYKFRSMRTGASDAIHREFVSKMLTEDPSAAAVGGFYKLAADPRITPIGVWLRRTSLDELPQLVNVVRGDMSLVGPRPVLAWEAALFTDAARVRFQVRPGLTGLWQVSGRARLTMLQALELDAQYVYRQSLWLDMAIIARTIPAQIRRGTA
jgi:lipopolysaccharide/colanic/teichoic acid biosynthesis glycosyltransferase